MLSVLIAALIISGSGLIAHGIANATGTEPASVKAKTGEPKTVSVTSEITGKTYVIVI